MYVGICVLQSAYGGQRTISGVRSLLQLLRGIQGLNLGNQSFISTLTLQTILQTLYIQLINRAIKNPFPHQSRAFCTCPSAQSSFLLVCDSCCIPPSMLDNHRLTLLRWVQAWAMLSTEHEFEQDKTTSIVFAFSVRKGSFCSVMLIVFLGEMVYNFLCV